MSKERARTRAEREATAARLARERHAQRQRETARRIRREHRRLTWRRNRLWTHASRTGRRQEQWAALLIGALVVMLLTYFITRSVGAVLLVALVSVIAVPAAAALMFEKRR